MGEVQGTGIIRRVDELGRIVIPKEIRRVAKIKDGDPLEISVDKTGTIQMKKYEPLRTIGDLARSFLYTGFEELKAPAFLCDTETILSATPMTPTCYNKGQRISDPLREAMHYNQGEEVLKITYPMPILPVEERVPNMEHSALTLIKVGGECQEILGALVILDLGWGVEGLAVRMGKVVARMLSSALLYY